MYANNLHNSAFFSGTKIAVVLKNIFLQVKVLQILKNGHGKRDLDDAVKTVQGLEVMGCVRMGRIWVGLLGQAGPRWNIEMFSSQSISSQYLNIF